MLVWSSGWNVPGFLPETEPMNFVEWSDARDAILEALVQASDDHADDSPSVAKIYDSAADNFRELRPGTEHFERIGFWIWWIARVDLPESEGNNSNG